MRLVCASMIAWRWNCCQLNHQIFISASTHALKLLYISCFQGRAAEEILSLWAIDPLDYMLSAYEVSCKMATGGWCDASFSTPTKDVPDSPKSPFWKLKRQPSKSKVKAFKLKEEEGKPSLRSRIKKVVMLQRAAKGFQEKAPQNFVDGIVFATPSKDPLALSCDADCEKTVSEKLQRGLLKLKAASVFKTKVKQINNEDAGRGSVGSEGSWKLGRRKVAVSARESSRTVAWAEQSEAKSSTTSRWSTVRKVVKKLRLAKRDDNPIEAEVLNNACGGCHRKADLANLGSSYMNNQIDGNKREEASPGMPQREVHSKAFHAFIEESDCHAGKTVLAHSSSNPGRSFTAERTEPRVHSAMSCDGLSSGSSSLGEVSSCCSAEILTSLMVRDRTLSMDHVGVDSPLDGDYPADGLSPLSSPGHCDCMNSSRSVSVAEYSRSGLLNLFHESTSLLTSLD